MQGQPYWTIAFGLIMAQSWKILRYIAVLAILAIFDHFGRGPPRATFRDSIFNLSHCTI